MYNRDPVYKLSAPKNHFIAGLVARFNPDKSLSALGVICQIGSPGRQLDIPQPLRRNRRHTTDTTGSYASVDSVAGIDFVEYDGFLQGLLIVYDLGHTEVLGRMKYGRVCSKTMKLAKEEGIVGADMVYDLGASRVKDILFKVARNPMKGHELLGRVGLGKYKTFCVHIYIPISFEQG